jgi:uncharacterized tellurite resistance protein B-like protein
MGLFDKILGGQSSENTALTGQEAFAGVLLITVAADGNISSEEVESIIAISNRMQLLRNQTADQFNSMVRKLQGLLQKHDASWLLAKAAEGMPAELRETAFAVSADLIFADGSVEDDEKVVLEAIQNAMGVGDELAIKIIEVLQIKNRG